MVVSILKDVPTTILLRRCFNMATLNQAPHLIHQGERTHQEKEGYQEYRLPQDLMDVILNNLSGRDANMLKIMIVLIGTKGDGSFSVSEKWLLERTGISHTKYIEARNKLCQMGWIRHRKSPAHEYYILTVNFDAIFDYKKEEKNDTRARDEKGKFSYEI